LTQLVLGDNVYSAGNPGIWIVGRSHRHEEADVSLSGFKNGTYYGFNWESTQFYMNVAGATYVTMTMGSVAGAVGRFITYIDLWEQTAVWVTNETSNYLIARGIDPSSTVQIRLINVLEPAFTVKSGADHFFVFGGFETDGIIQTPGPFRERKIELVGDSISAGFGSRGFAVNGKTGCPVTPYTSGNPYAYNWQIAEHFKADLVPIAWSGKGMYENCCDKGPTMPFYYLQSVAGNNYARDWDFSRYVPDMMIINLGTNDFGHYGGPAWAKEFELTFSSFIKNVTLKYSRPRLPFFIAQGPMDCGVKLNTSLQNIVTSTTRAGFNTMYLNLCGPPNDGCGGHPGVVGNAMMTKQAIPVIASVMGWSN